MKIKISSLPEERREADLICRFVKGLYPGAKVRESNARSPQKVLYVTTNRRGGEGKA